jgi:hypothetical protein
MDGTGAIHTNDKEQSSKGVKQMIELAIGILLLVAISGAIISVRMYRHGTHPSLTSSIFHSLLALGGFVALIAALDNVDRIPSALIAFALVLGALLTGLVLFMMKHYEVAQPRGLVFGHVALSLAGILAMVGVTGLVY